MNNWTTEQENAINLRGKNLLVSAAAGSGKTAVLVERIIKLIIEDKVDIDKLLIVTFTNAAAAEMRERISRVLVRELEKDNENEEHLRNQLNLLGKASISTLHAFCIQVLRKNFYSIGLDPSFKIGDQGDLLILKQEVMEEVLEEAYQECDPFFKKLIEAYSENKGDKKIEELIISVFSFIQSQPDPFRWLEEMVEMFKLSTEELYSSPWISEIKKSIFIDLKGVEDLINECIALAESPGGPEAYIEAILKDKENLKTYKKNMEEYFQGNFDRASLVFPYAKLKTIKNDDPSVIPEIKDKFKVIREEYKKIIKDFYDKSILGKDIDSYRKDINEMYEPLKALLQLTLSFYKKYQQRKMEKGIVDFNDLEHYTLKILEDDDVAETYKSQYQYVFVDEYQDSNLVQETIINRVRRENNLFLVGDVKQSIYKFRLADPGLFIKKYNEYIKEEYKNEERIDLSKNFRSRKEILEGINYIFRKIMSEEIGDINYTSDAWLYPGAEFKEKENPEIDLFLIDKHEEEKEEDQEDESDLELKDLNDAETEAYFIAKQIKGIISEEANRSYKDIVVLLRSAKNWANVFNEVFIKEGIPVYTDDNQGYYETLEIKIFSNLLKIIDNPKDDISLISVLRSPIGNFSTQELIEIRKESPNKAFHEGIGDYLFNKDNQLSQKISNFFEQLDLWEKKAKYKKTEEFLWDLMIETGFFYYVGAMIRGKQRQANLKFLLERAAILEKKGMGGLFNFIRFSEEFQKAKGEQGIAKTIGENEDVVRIMTIHKSKGLEFPIVIAAAFGREFNKRDQIGDVLLHKDLGLGAKFVNPDRRVFRETLPQISIKKASKIENLSEEMRVLYVALTRAKEKLIICGTVKDIEKSKSKWSRDISPYEIVKAKNYLDWIGLSLHDKSGEINKDQKEWKINILTKKEILEGIAKDIKNKAIAKDTLINFDKNFSIIASEHINKNFSWEYPDQKSNKIPSKITVSDLKKVSVEDMSKILYRIPSLVKRPSFLEGKKEFSPSEKGVIIHFFMQNCDLEKVSTKDGIFYQIEMMIKNELLTKEESEIINPDKILKFFKSPLGNRMLNSKKIKREVSFVYKTDICNAVDDAEGCGENIFIQGVIDCYFEEDGYYILIDYKTDYVNEGSEEELLIKYDSQLKIYKEALRKISGKDVKEAFLYSFTMDKEILQV
ncbi:MAG: helicase-exonuclease AddAB subunit AddA [Eubacteriales bacterium]|nr:helicase-exonuclease AddAB subunit AddA [Eubacteriales bacterium]